MAKRFLPICQLLGQLEERMRWVCDCGVSVSRGCLSPTNRTAVTTTTTSPSRRLLVSCSALGDSRNTFGQCLGITVNKRRGSYHAHHPQPGAGTWWGWGSVRPLQLMLHTDIAGWQTRTVAVPMRSFQFSGHGWPFVRHGVAAGCEVHFAASKPARAGLSVFRSPVERYLLSLGLTGTPWTIPTLSWSLDKLIFKLKGSTRSSSPSGPTTGFRWRTRGLAR